MINATKNEHEREKKKAIQERMSKEGRERERELSPCRSS